MELDADSKTQLIEAVKAVFRNWNNPRANTHRRTNEIPYDWEHRRQPTGHGVRQISLYFHFRKITSHPSSAMSAERFVFSYALHSRPARRFWSLKTGGDTRLRFKIHVHQTETVVVAARPFKVVQQRPLKITGHIYALRTGLAQMG